jgi:hypothetical protein
MSSSSLKVTVPVPLAFWWTLIVPVISAGLTVVVKSFVAAGLTVVGDDGVRRPDETQTGWPTASRSAMPMA